MSIYYFKYDYLSQLSNTIPCLVLSLNSLPWSKGSLEKTGNLQKSTLKKEIILMIKEKVEDNSRQLCCNSVAQQLCKLNLEKNVYQLMSNFELLKQLTTFLYCESLRRWRDNSHVNWAGYFTMCISWRASVVPSIRWIRICYGQLRSRGITVLVFHLLLNFGACKVIHFHCHSTGKEKHPYSD